MKTLEQRLRAREITHLMERFELDVVDGKDGFECAFCELRIVAKNMRDARKVAEQTYGKCRSN